MKNILLLAIFGLTISCTPNKDITDIDSLLDAMYTRYQGVWFESFSFSQETIRYDSSGAIQSTAIWYEAVQYPDFFRIDFNDEQQRKVVFASDSAYRFVGDSLALVRYEPQEFLLFKGGMYKRSKEDSKNKLKEYGYDLSIFREDILDGRPAYVIGAEQGDLTTKQFWIDKEHFYTVRRISTQRSGAVLDVQYSDHNAIGGGWVEEDVRFFLDGRLIQDEIYFGVKVWDEMNPAIFDKSNPVPLLRTELNMKEDR